MNKISIIEQEFKKENYTLLSKTYKSSQKLKFICPNGHQHEISWSNWKSGKRCGICSGRYNITIDIIKEELKKENYKLLTTEYKNSHQYLEFICNNGHKHKITWNAWKNEKRCGYCSNRYDITIDIIKEELKKENYKLLTTEYKNNHQYLEFICNNGHKHKITWNAWKNGTRCGYCSGRYNIPNRIYIEEQLQKNKCKLIEIQYTKKDIKLIIQCINNHTELTTWNNWKKGNRCSSCKNERKITLKKIDKKLKTYNYQLISTNYINPTNPLTIKCDKNHIYSTKWNYIQQGSKCPHCSNNKSVAELEIKNIIETLNLSTTSNKQLIKPYELDIIIPEKSIAIEYCGLYWHSELQGKGKNYHLNKLKLCNDKGYRLITIFEDEWLNYKDVIINNILKICNINISKTVYARNCNIREIKNDIAFYFLQQYHLQNIGSSSIKLGAFHNEYLVAVMTFSRPSIAKGARNQDFWEINRFCTHKDYHIPGIASKLLTYFERNYDWNKIISYADRRWSEGNLYYKLGFNLVGETKPNYWYLDKNYKKRIHRFALRKKPDEPKNKTEWQLRQEQGYDRIWDCGSLKFEKN